MLAVLVVDDSPVVRFAVAKRLKDAGLEVIERSTAEPPPADVTARIACALLDLDLGDGADGTDVARALRDARPELPVAFFSATTSQEITARAGAYGPIFTKPEELDAAIAWVRGVTIS